MSHFNFNKVILGGRLTDEVELKQTDKGTMFSRFTIAVKRSGKDAETDFINCVAWKKTAEFIHNYFHKGNSICIVGSIQTRKWENKKGEKETSTEVIVSEASFVDSKTDTPAAPQMTDVTDDDDLPF